MGVLRKKENNLTEENIQDKLSALFMSESNVKYRCENLFVFKKWESDLILITKSNLIYEFEIKISKADFNNDFKKKTEKHKILLENKENIQKPNYFYYAVPENLINEQEIPEYAGLIYMIDCYPFFKIIKTAPRLDKNKYTSNDLNLTDKFYYNYRQNKMKLRQKNNEIEEVKELLDEATNKPENEKLSYDKLLEKYNKLNDTNAVYELQEEEYIKKMTTLQKDLIVDGYIMRELRNILKENNIEYDYDKILNESLEYIKNKNRLILW